MNKKDVINSSILREEKMKLSYKPAADVKDCKLEISEDIISIFKETLLEKDLYIDNDDVLTEIVTGVIKGNIILQGPPGTGKTAISNVICEVFNVDSMTITAIDDWTTYDTIGGYFPKAENGKEVIVGRNGQITDSIVKCCDTIIDREIKTEETARENKRQASWLIIDELNRAEIDKVFGDLFTVMGSGDNHNDKSLNLWFHENEDKQQLVIPNRYRIIGLMNSVDKNYVYDLSQALSRRFTFITILPPNIKAMPEELKVVKGSLANRIISKVEVIGDRIIKEEDVKRLLSDSQFLRYEDTLITLLQHIRYDAGEDASSNSDEYLGLQLGTAQIKDLYETILINMLLVDYENSTDKDGCIKTIFDNAFASNIVSQVAGHTYDKKCKFIDYFSGDVKYEWMQKSKKLLEEAKLR